ncbi:hypothetical protein ACIQ9P_28480, partial [Kitasatospora sp. NPDC094019]
MTVLHSRNADAADAAGSADVKDTTATDTAAAATTTDTDLREELGRYAELGAFTLTADTHPWYAALDTVATPEDARAASTVLAELRGHDLQQVWDDVTALAADVRIDAPDTVGKTAVLVEMLQLLRRTSTVLAPAAYEADLESLIAATADRTWRRERGVKLSWLRGRSLRKQATALAVTTGRPRGQDLHEALASAEVERRAWAALAPAGTPPTAPSDAALAHRTAQAFEAINTGVRELARLLTGHDLDALSFPDLVDLVDRLAADEGTLYRLPTVRALRASLEDAGLADLLAELAAARADRRAAEAAYTARQALAGGQRDGLVPPVAEDRPVAEAIEAEVEAEDVTAEDATAEVVTAEAATETVTEVDSQEADVPAEEPQLAVALPAPSPAADDLLAAVSTPPAQAAAPEAETVPPVEVEAVAAPEAEPEVEAVVEATVVKEAPEPVVEAEAVVASVEVVAEPVTEVLAEVEPVVEVEPESAVVATVEAEAAPEAEPEVEAVVEATVVEEAPEPVVEAEAVVASVEVVAEPVTEVLAEVE